MSVRFEIGRAIPGTDKFAEIFATKMIKQRENPDFTIPKNIFSFTQLCNSDENAQIRFSVWNKNNKMINSIQTTCSQLMNGSHSYDGMAGSTCTFQNFRAFERPTFLDYLRAGWQISVVTAIDYTASNGNPSSSNSLHYLGKNNQYEAALWSVGSVLEPYDSDKAFPCFGFGGIPRHMGVNGVNHCFAVNGNAA